MAGMNLSGRNAGRTKGKAILNPIEARQTELLKRGLGTSTLSGNNFSNDPTKGYSFPTDIPAVDPRMEAKEVFKRLSENKGGGIPEGIYGGYTDQEALAKRQKSLQLESILENARQSEKAMGGPSASFSYPSLESPKTPVNEIEKLIDQSGPKSDEMSQQVAAANALSAANQEDSFAQGVPLIDDNAANLSKEKGEKVVLDLFSGSMKEYYNALKQEVPGEINREKSLEEYKNEFAQATGLNIDGKPDKSEALMAMGLAMMQNRAGKGFNVGKILNSVGAAGEKAMPYLTKAKSEAKQARMAAGQYALQQIKSDEDAREAVIASNRALKQELAINDLEYQQKRQLALDKALLEGNETKIAEALKNTKQQTIKIGGKEVKIGYGRDVESGGKTVFATPEPDATQVASAYKKTGQGINTLRQMEDIMIEIRDRGEENFGGSALDGIVGKLISVGNSMGMNLEYPDGGEISLRDEFDTLKKNVLVEFKKFMAQETGNGISNVDVAALDEALGDYNYFQDPEKALNSISLMTDMFERSQESLDETVDMFMNRKYYSDNKAGDAAFNEVVNIFSRSFQNVSLIEPTVVEGENGQTFIDYDIRSR